MIELRSSPVVEATSDGKWQLVFWMGDAFEFATPFRAALDEIADALRREAHSIMQLPECEEFEDFVEGTLHFGDNVLHVYFEHSLGYLALSTDSEEPLRRTAELIQPRVIVT